MEETKPLPQGWRDFEIQHHTYHEGMVFVSAPSAGIVEKKKGGPSPNDIRWEFRTEFLQVMARLRIENPNAEFFSPSLQNSQLLPFMPPDTPANYEAWRIRCIIGLRACTKLLILPFYGWRESDGVKDEVWRALDFRIPVVMDGKRELYNIVHDKIVHGGNPHRGRTQL